MKIGIITFHRAQNYGAVLQCYALFKVLKSMGHDVEVIDYYPKYFQQEYAVLTFNKPYKMSFLSKFKYILKTLLVIFIKIKRKKVFENFLKKIPLSKNIIVSNDNPPKGYDFIFFGSDQIWNYKLTYGIDKIFSGNFEKGETKFIAYAASTNSLLLNKGEDNYFNSIINNFDYISTRESYFNFYLNSLQAHCSTHVLDPTLLLNFKIFNEIAEEPKINDYLLIYTVPQSKKVLELAKMIATEKKLKILELRPNARLILNRRVIQTASPEEFLGYFKNASYIVTTSFHGTCFSLKYQKQFVTLAMGNTVDNRAKDLLKTIQLEERIILPNNLHVPKIDIDYEHINPLLDEKIHMSINYIKRSLKDEN